MTPSVTTTNAGVVTTRVEVGEDITSNHPVLRLSTTSRAQAAASPSPARCSASRRAYGRWDHLQYALFSPPPTHPPAADFNSGCRTTTLARTSHAWPTRSRTSSSTTRRSCSARSGLPSPSSPTSCRTTPLSSPTCPCPCPSAPLTALPRPPACMPRRRARQRLRRRSR